MRGWQVLCIHLKRFRFDKTATKIVSVVSFPLEGLSLKPYSSEHLSADLCTYDLAAIVNHRGDAGSMWMASPPPSSGPRRDCAPLILTVSAGRAGTVPCRALLQAAITSRTPATTSTATGTSLTTAATAAAAPAMSPTSRHTCSSTVAAQRRGPTSAASSSPWFTTAPPPTLARLATRC